MLAGLKYKYKNIRVYGWQHINECVSDGDMVWTRPEKQNLLFSDDRIVLDGLGVVDGSRVVEEKTKKKIIIIKEKWCSRGNSRGQGNKTLYGAWPTPAKRENNTRVPRLRIPVVYNSIRF